MDKRVFRVAQVATRAANRGDITATAWLEVLQALEAFLEPGEGWKFSELLREGEEECSTPPCA